MSVQRFSSIDPGEAVMLSFDFSARLAAGETLTGTPSVAVTVFKGTDGSPSNILNGAAALDSSSTVANVPVHNGLDGVQYNVKCTCTTTNAKKTLVLNGILPIEPQ